MRSGRGSVRWLSGWLVVGMLLSQFLTAAYACPAAAGAASPWSAMAATADMEGCDGMSPRAMDPEQPQLCQAHCQQGSQTVQPTPVADAPPAPVLLAVLDWDRAWHLALAVPDVPAELRPGASPPGAPPIYLRLLVLRN